MYSAAVYPAGPPDDDDVADAVRHGRSLRRRCGLEPDEVDHDGLLHASRGALGGDPASDVVHVEVAQPLDDLLERRGRQCAGLENTRMPSRNAISVGMLAMRAAVESCRWSSVSTLPNVMSGCFSLAAS